MQHGPSLEWKAEKSTAVKTRIGIRMFLIYSIIYTGFVLISVLNPAFMKKDVGSLNVAIVYGFALIIFALLQALVYNVLCTRAERKLDSGDAAADKPSTGGKGAS